MAQEIPRPPPGGADVDARRHFESLLTGLRTNRYSWWVHWRELADYLLPRRYKWLITPNQQSRGSPINQHILDSTGTLYARALAAGLMSGVASPAKRWFKLKVGRRDSAFTDPVGLWLSEVERLTMLIMHESNFYTSLAVAFFDLVIFGTAVMVIYEDFDDVITCINPCAGEYYLDVNKKYEPSVLAREFTYTIPQTVGEFGLNNVSENVRQLYKQQNASLTREIVVAHVIEPNTDYRRFGVPEHFKFREVYWEWGGSASPQGGSAYAPGFLRKQGFNEQPFIAVRWDTVSNDAYGRGPGMDALPDVKQLQQEVRRKAQGIDKQVNPPMVADIQLKNKPASLLPGGITYIAGMTSGRTGFAPAYTVAPNLRDMTEDLAEVRERLKRTFYNDVLLTISQYETRSNITAVEIDARKAETLVMLGPVFGRIAREMLAPAISRIFSIAYRAGVYPPPPPELEGMEVDIEFLSILATAQQAAQASGIERTLGLAGNLVGVDPQVMDNIDIDYAVDVYSKLMNNDPRLIRSPDQLAAIRQARQQAQAQAAQVQQADIANKIAQGAKTLSETEVGGGKNALQSMAGV